MVQIIDEMKVELDGVTDSDLRRVERGLSAPADGEDVLGILHNEESRRLYALTGIYSTGAVAVMIEARLKANSEEEDKAAHYAYERLQGLSKLAFAIFQAQARDDLGGKAWCKPISVRSGWVAVVAADPVGGFISELKRAFEGQS